MGGIDDIAAFSYLKQTNGDGCCTWKDGTDPLCVKADIENVVRFKYVIDT
jgi:hypothetical protein